MTNDRQQFDLQILRNIGWKYWDPIGVVGPAAGWPDDEYDTYLLAIAGALWNGGSQSDAVDYLVKIETEHMGLKSVEGMNERARLAVAVVGDYLSTLHR